MGLLSGFTIRISYRPGISIALAIHSLDRYSLKALPQHQIIAEIIKSVTMLGAVRKPHLPTRRL